MTTTPTTPATPPHLGPIIPELVTLMGTEDNARLALRLAFEAGGKITLAILDALSKPETIAAICTGILGEGGWAPDSKATTLHHRLMVSKIEGPAAGLPVPMLEAVKIEVEKAFVMMMAGKKDARP